MTGLELHTLRETIHFSPEALAVALNCTPDHVHRMESGEEEISKSVTPPLAWPTTFDLCEESLYD